MEQHLGIGILMQDIAETFEEWKNRHLCNLKKNSNLSIKYFGKNWTYVYKRQEIHLSVSAVIERIRKMEETGVIKEYTIIVDEKKTGNEMTALMEVSLEHPKFFDSFADAIQKLEYIVSCYYQTGDFDLIIRISCHSSDELEEIHRQVMSLPGVDATRTHVVLKNVKNIYSAIRRPDK